jgi:6-phospho-beta-glucosidase
VTRLCIVGGGSAYMPGIAYALAHHRDPFSGATVVLQDVDADALDLQRRLTERILRARGVEDIVVEARTDRRRALDGADLVLIAFRPGGFPARHLDESIALEHGIVGQETAGPGGFAMALRSVPIVLDILRDVREVAAPGCSVFDYTNPVQIVTEAASRHADDVAFVGLCDQTAGEVAWLAQLLGVGHRQVEIDTCGTNHMTFTRAVRVDGVDETSRVWELLDAIALGELEDEAHRRIVRLFRLLRHIPSEYMQYFFFHDEVVAEQRAKGITRAQEVMGQLPPVVASYRAEAESADPHPSMARASEGHGDFAVSIMAMALGSAPGRFILNLPNHGAIDDLPEGAVVEAPGIIRGRSAELTPQGSLPAEVSGLVRQVAEHARLAADAAVTGDRTLAVKALALHPLVRSVGTAESLVDAYRAAHATFLPPSHLA